MATLYYLPQKKLTTLSTPGGITTAAQTTGIKIADVTGIDITKPGIICINWAQPLNESAFEYISYTSIDGSNELQGVTRGAEGSTARDSHTNGSVVAFVVSKSHINNINTAFDTAFDVSTLRLKTENVYAADTGSANAYVVTLSPAPTAYVTGMEVVFKATNANTTASTINVNALGAKSIVKNASSALISGDISANQIITLRYDGTNFVIQGTVRAVLSDDWIAATDGATITLDLSNRSSYRLKFKTTLGGNRTIALSNVLNDTFMIQLNQDGTGSRTVTWPGIKADTVTMTIATPGVVTTTMDMPTCTPIIFTTTGALPTGLTAGTRYYWVRQSATTGNVATSIANAQAGTVIATSGSQSGVQTMTTQIRWGSGDTLPTLTTGKYRQDTFGITISDYINGLASGFVVGQDN